jgi:hypothetical protein
MSDPTSTIGAGPVEAETIIVRNPLAAIQARLATTVVDEATSLTQHGRFSFE